MPVCHKTVILSTRTCLSAAVAAAVCLGGGEEAVGCCAVVSRCRSSPAAMTVSLGRRWRCDDAADRSQASDVGGDPDDLTTAVSRRSTPTHTHTHTHTHLTHCSITYTRASSTVYVLFESFGQRKPPPFRVSHGHQT